MISHKRPVNTIDTWDVTRAGILGAEMLILADLSYVTVPWLDRAPVCTPVSRDNTVRVHHQEILCWGF